MTDQDPILRYSDSGVNYDLMDPFKIACQKAALSTSQNMNRFSKFGLEVHEITSSRGESAFEIEFNVRSATEAFLPQYRTFRIAHVEEGLGTKNEIADQMRQLQEKFHLADDVKNIFGKSFYKGPAIDNAAMILNDLSTVGASPISFLLHVAAESSQWFTDEEKTEDLIAGTVEACNQARCNWGGGESPTLRDIINPGHCLLSGSAIGLEFPRQHGNLTANEIKEGNRIILLGSSGPHANGITLLRKGLLERLPHGYETTLPDGQTYGEAVLTPTVIYAKLIDTLLDEPDVFINYALHISGHGWRKLMRAQRELTYVIDKIPTPQPIFQLVQEASGMTNEQIYGDYNMGAGFALFVPSKSVDKILTIGKKMSIKVLDAGYVEAGPRRVVINPLGVEFKGDSLQIR